MRRIPTAHLLYGHPGVGKTTFAGRLERRHLAVRFTPDGWISALFGPDPPAAAFARHDAALKAQLQPLWTRLLALGVDVVLDYGFWTRRERDDVHRHVRTVGAIPRLYGLALDSEEAWRRVATRNLADPWGLQISRSTYEVLRSRVEPLGADEPFALVG